MGEVTISDSTLDDLVAVQRNRTELATCLRELLKELELRLRFQLDITPALTDAIERSESALKEYDK